MYKTQAVKRLEAFFEANYEKLFRVAVRDVGEHLAWDAVNNTYLSLMEKEERGRGEYNESYGTSYDAYIFGALYGNLKGMRKVSPEVNEADLGGVNEEGGDKPTYFDTLGTEDDLDAVLTNMGGPMQICSEFVAACDSCDADVDALVRAIRQPENLSPKFLHRFFATLRKAAKYDGTIMSAIEDFVHLYGETPQEVNRCLVQLGVHA